MHVARAGLLLALAALAIGCGRDAATDARPAVATPVAAGPDASALLAPYLPVRFGASLAELRAALPTLAATGWTSGTRATWLAVQDGAELELETDAERLVAVTLTLRGELGVPVAERLERELPAATDCSPLPDDIGGGFRPQLWVLPGGGSAAAIRKRKLLMVELRQPAAPDFAAQVAACARARAP